MSVIPQSPVGQSFDSFTDLLPVIPANAGMTEASVIPQKPVGQAVIPLREERGMTAMARAGSPVALSRSGDPPMPSAAVANPKIVDSKKSRAVAPGRKLDGPASVV